MTPAKLKALQMLAERSRLTGKCTNHRVIGGRVAACLEREGLARNVTTPNTWTTYESTEAGRQALKEE